MQCDATLMRWICALNKRKCTFIRNIAFFVTHVQVGQIPLPRPTDVASDSWPEAGIHDGMDAVINGVYNEGNSCSTAHAVGGASHA